MGTIEEELTQWSPHPRPDPALGLKNNGVI